MGWFDEQEAPAKAAGSWFDEAADEPVIVEEQHPALSNWDRVKVMNLADTSDTAKRYLEGKGFEVVDKGNFDFAIRKPGETEYKKVDPSGMEWGKEAMDWGGDAVRGIGGAIGGTVGTAAGLAAGAPTGPGAIASGVAGGMAGAAVGSAGAQGLLSLGGQALGMQPTGAEAAQGIAGEAALGAVGEGVGKLIGVGFKAAKPHVNKAATKVGQALQAPMRAPALLAEKVTGAFGQSEAKEAAKKGLIDVLENTGRNPEVTSALSANLREKGLQTLRNPLVGIDEVREIAQRVREPFVGTMENDARDLLASLQSVRRAIGREMKDPKSALRQSGQDLTELDEASISAINNVRSIVQGPSKGKTIQLADGLSRVQELDLPRLEEAIREHSSLDGMQDLITETGGINNKLAQTLSGINRNMYKGNALSPLLSSIPKIIRGGTMLGAAGSLATPFAAVGAVGLGLQGAGKALEYAGRKKIPETFMNKLSSAATRSPLMARTLMQGIDKTVYNHYLQQRGQ